MGEMINLSGQELFAALGEFAEVGLRWRKNRLEAISNTRRKLVHIGMYFIAPMHRLLFLMMSR
jgi:hypothetical protein